ncbi:MAG: hypothetical protein M1836_000677 [Candelina mexicana]|nr:MAG: hypothetical protein M1836_000677 [Candelina mexicana]
MCTVRKIILACGCIQYSPIKPCRSIETGPRCETGDVVLIDPPEFPDVRCAKLRAIGLNVRLPGEKEEVLREVNLEERWFKSTEEREESKTNGEGEGLKLNGGGEKLKGNGKGEGVNLSGTTFDEKWEALQVNGEWEPVKVNGEGEASISNEVGERWKSNEEGEEMISNGVGQGWRLNGNKGEEPRG